MPIQLDAPLSASIAKSRKYNKKMIQKKKSTGSPKVSNQFKVKSKVQFKNPALASRVSFPDSSPRNRRNQKNPKKIHSKKSFKPKRDSKTKKSIEELDAELEAYMSNSN